MPLQYVVVCCSVLLQCVAQGVAMCCSVLDTGWWRREKKHLCVVVGCSVLQCVAVCCSVLQCVVVGCSVLQCVAAYVCRASLLECARVLVCERVCMCVYVYGYLRACVCVLCMHVYFHAHLWNKHKPCYRKEPYNPSKESYSTSKEI